MTGRTSGDTERGRGTPNTSWPDTKLVRACLRGSEEAWHSIVDKYKNLIYSVPIKQGLAPEDAADVFQEVCLELLTWLPRLREPRALPAWLLKVTAHKCFHWRRKKGRFTDGETVEALPDAQTDRVQEDLIWQIEQEQILREVVLELSPRCRTLIEMLFFETPARPYTEVAESLGIATGSIGFTRRACLDKMRRSLERMGIGND